MKNVSNDFKNIIKSGGAFYTYATAVLANGTSLTFDSYNDFSEEGNSYSESGGDGFPLGVALSKQITINIDNIDGRFSEYDFYGAVITAYTEADLPDGTNERIPEGRFTVIDSVAPGDVLEIVAYDNMYKLDSDFVSKLTYPATLQQMWNELCSYYDLTNGSPSFMNNDFTVMSAPSGLTGRELAGYIAQMAIGNAVVDANGRLCIKSYDFTPFDNAETVTAGEIETASGVHILSDFTTDPDIGTDNVSITGIMTTVKDSESNEDTTLLYGTDVYALSIDNPLITGKESTAIAIIGDALIGVTVRPFSGEFSPNPTVEVMDLVYVVDKKDNVYKSFVTENDFEYLGNSSVSNGLESPERNRSTYSGNATEVYRRVQQQINNQKNEFETAVGNLENQLKNASGLYETDEMQPDGSRIYYFHNKPTLEESDTIIKITSQALGISTDGGVSYPVGITVDGEAIVSILQTVGINADWINTGAIQVADDEGNIIFSVNMDTKQIIISGDSVRIGGKTATAAINDVLQESKDYSDGKLADFADTVTEDLTSLQAQVDGQIETFYEDYEPSLQNYPASDWTTTEERKKHEGDLFYWKSKGYAYRFFQDGSTWKWQLVQDTDITQAMAAAEKAQDTADGKRRVFVVTPQPPYDIGDLWTDGTDVLTCVVSRPQGSVYASSDWQKLNGYTDDTVANEALEEARKSRNLNIILDNEYQGIPSDYQGNISNFPTVQTGVQVLYGHEDVSVDCIYAVAKSNSVTGNWNNTTRIYTVTGLSEDTGWVDITASYLDIFTVTKRFNVQKVKGGVPGEEGQQGEQGEPGAQGQPGKDGADGVSVTGTTVTYQGSTSGTSIPTGTWSSYVPSVAAGQYLWTRTQFNYSDGNHSYSYSVGKIGNTGDKGDKGDTGAPGQDGTDGKGIRSIVNHYLATASASGVTTSTSGWTTTIQSITATKKYLWNYETISYTDGSSTNTTPCIIGAYGNTGATGATGAPGKDGADGTDGKNGATGNGISSITEHYAVSTSNSTAPSSWSTTVPTMTTTNRYLWNYETIKYTNGTSVDTAKRVIGVYGNTGDKGDKGDTGAPGQDGTDGKGIRSTATTYQVSSSGTTIPTGTWSSSIPSVAAGQYLWIRTVTTYTDGTTTTGYSVSRNGTNGSNGADGAPGRTYMVEPSVNVLKRSADNSIAPNFIEFKSYYRDGNSATRTAYAGRWIIEETADGDDWTTIYTSSANESSVTHYLYSMLADSDGSAIANANGDTIGIPRDIVAIRAKLYAAGGTTNLLDMQSVAVVVDIDGLTSDEVFNILTENGTIQGIYKEGNQLYINASYIKSGKLVVGSENGNYDGYEGFLVYDASGKEFFEINKNGIVLNLYDFVNEAILKATPNGQSIEFTKSHSGYDDRTFLSPSNLVQETEHGQYRDRSQLNSNQLVLENYEYDGNGNQTAYEYTIISPGYWQTSGSKSRIVKTKSFENVLQYCYEMPTPFFGDIGTSALDENGVAYISIDEVFKETINSERCTYYVFLQKNGAGDIWVEEKNPNYIVVKGTPKLKFDWEIKARQKGYEEIRLDKFEKKEEDAEIDYYNQGINFFKEYVKEMENAL